MAFFGVGGPNFTSSLHVISESFDRVYDQASLTSPALTNVQTTLVPPGGATMVEFSLEVPGRYILVDHALADYNVGWQASSSWKAPKTLKSTTARLQIVAVTSHLISKSPA